MLPLAGEFQRFSSGQRVFGDESYLYITSIFSSLSRSLASWFVYCNKVTWLCAKLSPLPAETDLLRWSFYPVNWVHWCNEASARNYFVRWDDSSIQCISCWLSALCQMHGDTFSQRKQTGSLLIARVHSTSGHSPVDLQLTASSIGKFNGIEHYWTIPSFLYISQACPEIRSHSAMFWWGASSNFSDQ